MKRFLLLDLVWVILMPCFVSNPQIHAADATVAQRTAVRDQNLLNTDTKVRAMVRRLSLTYIEIIQIQSPQAPTVPSLTNRDPNLSIPAPIPAQFSPPPVPLPQKP